MRRTYLFAVSLLALTLVPIASFPQAAQERLPRALPAAEFRLPAGRERSTPKKRPPG